MFFSYVVLDFFFAECTNCKSSRIKTPILCWWFLPSCFILMLLFKNLRHFQHETHCVVLHSGLRRITCLVYSNTKPARWNSKTYPVVQSNTHHLQIVRNMEKYKSKSVQVGKPNKLWISMFPSDAALIKDFLQHSTCHFCLNSLVNDDSK